MNILIIPSWYATNSNPTNGSFFREQAMALKEAGHNVIVAFVEVRLASRDLFSEKVDIKDDNGIKTYRIIQEKIPKTGNIGTAIAFRRGLIKIIKNLYNRENIDIVHLHSCIWGGIGAVSASRKLNIPLVITEHSSYYSRYRVKMIEKLILRYSFKSANKVISVSNSLREIISKYKSNIEVIPNMVDCDKVLSIINKKNNLGEEGQFTFLSLCYLKKNKGIDILIRAFSTYFRGKEVKLIIAGDGPERENLENLSKELGILEQVEFKGALNRDEVYKVMSNCNIFVLPSRFETFGVVLIEALANGKPVISTRNGGANDIVTDENGILVDIDDIEGLGKAMVDLKLNYNKYNEEEIRNSCINKYSKKIITRQLEKVYSELICKK
ncbi:glycosyltransferase [Clostridium tertium]|uniref:glycosyltransferase n=1 Tax=Clostridium TaxID=1485 RepID=UPI000DD0382E|nr:MULTISPECIES: glycosyltransferase [Clostridium]MBU6134396.1 glycosyltransferase [Clostridium tertium]MDB1934335.1 glycosyltransferase [Clostridium tertium]MDB1935835.1 glycosyltransferase [Clostridium tertium]MDB1953662.1 glycosyltransferase [Clostridium tertium]MDB1957778.1 glycosyltransferase [Clostridium tertium]